MAIRNGWTVSSAKVAIRPIVRPEARPPAGRPVSSIVMSKSRSTAGALGSVAGRRSSRDGHASVPGRPCQTCAVRVYLGSDHAGFELKDRLVQWLTEACHAPVDCGPSSYQPEDDYPVYVMRAASSAVADPGSLGIVIGGSGNGEQIASNKVRGVRAALAWTAETARLARLHNDANVL